MYLHQKYLTCFSFGSDFENSLAVSLFYVISVLCNLFRMPSINKKKKRHNEISFSHRSYKELMAKCNSLGRGEARSTRKLEKAKEKILKLKVIKLLSLLFLDFIQPPMVDFI